MKKYTDQSPIENARPNTAAVSQKTQESALSKGRQQIFGQKDKPVLSGMQGGDICKWYLHGSQDKGPQDNPECRTTGAAAGCTDAICPQQLTACDGREQIRKIDQDSLW